MLCICPSVAKHTKRNFFVFGKIMFITRDAMRKRGLCCRPVSVRLSVTLVYCIHTAENIVKLLSRPGIAHNSSFFDPSTGTQFSGDAKYTGMGKQRFSTETAVYLRNGTR